MGGLTAWDDLLNSLEPLPPTRVVVVALYVRRTRQQPTGVAQLRDEEDDVKKAKAGNKGKLVIMTVPQGADKSEEELPPYEVFALDAAPTYETIMAMQQNASEA